MPNCSRRTNRRRCACCARRRARICLLTADHAGRADPAQPRPARPAGERAGAAYRLGHRHRRRHRAPVGGARCHRGAADLFAPGDRLQPRSRGAELDRRRSARRRRSRAIADCRPSERAARRAGDLRALSCPHRGLLDARQAAGRRTVFVAMHSFTPVFKGESRAHAGRRAVQPRCAARASIVLELLRAEGDLEVGDNEPYAVSDVTDYGVPVHGERRGLPHVEIEIRQDLIADEAGQARLGGAVRAAASAAATLERAPGTDGHAEPRGADRAGARRAAVRRRAELQRAAGWRRIRRNERRPSARRATAGSSARCARPRVPNMQRLQAACRRAGIEVMYTVIEA